MLLKSLCWWPDDDPGPMVRKQNLNILATQKQWPLKSKWKKGNAIIQFQFPPGWHTFGLFIRTELSIHIHFNATPRCRHFPDTFKLRL